MKAAFKTPGFPRLYAGLTASMVGDSIMLLVLSMWVKTLTGSNAQAGLTFFFMMVPALFAPLMGVWLDRVRRKPFLVWGNLASAVMVLPLVLVRDAGDVWMIWAVAFLYGVSFVVLPAALNGLLKEMVPEEHLVDANASLQTTKEAFRLFGPLLGAAMFAWTGGWLVALIDAATFAIAAAVIASIRIREDAPERDELPPVRSDRCWSPAPGGRPGARKRAGRLRPDHAGARLLRGLDLRAAGCLRQAGDVRRRVRHHPGRRCDRGRAVRGVADPAYRRGRGLRPRPGDPRGLDDRHRRDPRPVVVMLACAGVMGVSLPLLTIGYLTLIQKRTPQAVMGRVSTAAEVVMSAPYAVSLPSALPSSPCSTTG